MILLLKSTSSPVAPLTKVQGDNAPALGRPCWKGWEKCRRCFPCRNFCARPYILQNVIFYCIPYLRLRKRQAKHVLKARSWLRPIHFPPIKHKITLHCKSRPTPQATSPQKSFSTSYSIRASTVHAVKINTYQWGTKWLSIRATFSANSRAEFANRLWVGQVFVAVTKRESCIYFQPKLHLCAVSCIYAHIWLWKTWNNLFCMQKSKKLRKVACKNRKSCNIKFLETAQNIELYISWVFRKL